MKNVQFHRLTHWRGCRGSGFRRTGVSDVQAPQANAKVTPHKTIVVKVIQHKAASPPHQSYSPGGANMHLIPVHRNRHPHRAPYWFCCLMSRFDYQPPDMSGHVLRPPLPPQNRPFTCGDLDAHLTRFLAPSQVHNPNGISIGLVDRQTDRQTERPRYSVCNNRPHRRSTVMRPKNWRTEQNSLDEKVR